ncbi:MAG: hypothetical protein COU06_00605 [Candidatus Harrisonbacteria bacterium CG10_big_fil_rev_8_21_14_0_10_38_8]|uniref:Bacterial type II secretion system protein E domain-containing protein n=1 Tax=Candidatus Harrisonbacteria bacterium CG10_big_fil_rev_8_21_14_0_10_38_8 TaxID=1974582 RepID=A0A2M6WKP6_9BACT|nr:MAG: hypothetical protein COU06_00605 [Candidatus Harrisonbacteria bacterium CG10_big_fil_rev_8_21_14_0_10_38_8]
MISNDDPKLKKQLEKLWRQSEERLVEQKTNKQKGTYIDLTQSPIDLNGLKLIGEERARELEAVIFTEKGKKIALAVFDPEKKELIEYIKKLKEKGFEAVIYTTSRESLRHAFSFYNLIPKEGKDITNHVDISSEEVVKLKNELVSLNKVNTHIENLLKKEIVTTDILNGVLAGALTNRASDIHFETSKQCARLRYRVDGVLQDVVKDIPHEVYKLILSRIKLLANLRLNVNNAAQDGRFTLKLGDVDIELRIAIAPSEFGEAVVMRVLDPSAIEITLLQLGLRQDDLDFIQEELKAPNGMILNTGPTGSGKTTTLYAFLRSMTSSETKIITIEDPIEYHLPGIEQTQVDNKAGYTFANGLRSMMRQDPDIILVGEIRDEETADIAIQAALTGHLVFSTLHTNSASGVIPRLLNLKAPVASLGPAINLVIAQRLVRKLCVKCKKEVALTDEMKKKITEFYKNLPEKIKVKDISEVKIFEKGGDADCKECNGTGYRGRMGVYELLKIGDKMEELIEKKAGEVEIERFAKEQGMITLAQDGILRILDSVTSFEEVESVTGSLKEVGF